MSSSSQVLPVASSGAVSGESIGRLILSTVPSAGPLFLRLAIAVVMFPHGAQKLFGWFGGPGADAALRYFTQQMGLPYAFALGAILIEFCAPLFLVLGFATRPAALSLEVIMTSAMVMVQWPHGFFMNWSGQQAGEGIQFTLLFLGAVLSLLVTGGGRGSLDRWLGSFLTSGSR